MLKILHLLSEVVNSIPTHNIDKVTNQVFNYIRKSYPNLPEYIINDFLSDKDFRGKSELEILFFLKEEIPYYFKNDFKLKIIEVNPEDFTEETIRAFIDRDFGNIDTYLVPKDKERMDYQRKIATSKGMNEPVIIIRHKNGKYELIEGWHRTMSILKLGDNGEDLKNWDRVKIRAFVSEE